VWYLSASLYASMSRLRIPPQDALAPQPAVRHLLRARDLADRQYASPETDVSAMARAAHASPAHFSRNFAAAFGIPPGRYLQERRITRAAFLLRETPLSVTEIAYDVGFRSLGTFSRTFSRLMGVSPRAYRRSVEPVPIPSCFRFPR
jgi:AraC-like DNA-binding protein